MSATKEPKATEHELALLLERKHASTGNGGSGEFAFMTQVRNDAGFSATRTFDAVAVSLWPSRGHAIDVFEIKVSRSDWLRELKDPAKSEAAWQIGNRFWIVATRGIVDVMELPPGWGLIEAYGATITDEGVTGRKLRTCVQAEFRGGRVAEVAKQPISRGLLVAMLRRAGAVPDRQTPSERIIEAAQRRGYEEARDQFAEIGNNARSQLRDVMQAVNRFASRSGISVLPRHGWTQEQIDERADQVRAALADEHHAEAVRVRLQRMRDELAHGLSTLDSLLETSERPTMGRID